MCTDKVYSRINVVVYEFEHPQGEAEASVTI